MTEMLTLTTGFTVEIGVGYMLDPKDNSKEHYSDDKYRAASGGGSKRKMFTVRIFARS